VKSVPVLLLLSACAIAWTRDFSPLQQINASNVRELTVAWVYHTGDAVGTTPIECTPLLVDGTMYVVTSAGRVAALDPATGVQRWSYETRNDAVRSGHQRASRGVAFWRDGLASRILYGTPDGRLISLDAKTGRPDPALEIGFRERDGGVGPADAVVQRCGGGERFLDAVVAGDDKWIGAPQERYYISQRLRLAIEPGTPRRPPVGKRPDIEGRRCDRSLGSGGQA
jgi:hypothetical protein